MRAFGRPVVSGRGGVYSCVIRLWARAVCVYRRVGHCAVAPLVHGHVGARNGVFSRIPLYVIKQMLTLLDPDVFWEAQFGFFILVLFFTFSRSECPCPKAFTGQESFDPSKHSVIAQLSQCTGARGAIDDGPPDETRETLLHLTHLEAVRLPPHPVPPCALSRPRRTEIGWPARPRLDGLMA